jgi:hypothetical protein
MEGTSGRKTQRVEGSGAIAPNDHVLRLKILHRTIERFLIRFEETRTLLRWRLREGSGTSGGNRKEGTVTNNN